MDGPGRRCCYHGTSCVFHENVSALTKEDSIVECPGDSFFLEAERQIAAFNDAALEDQERAFPEMFRKGTTTEQRKAFFNCGNVFHAVCEGRLDKTRYLTHKWTNTSVDKVTGRKTMEVLDTAYARLCDKCVDKLPNELKARVEVETNRTGRLCLVGCECRTYVNGKL